MSRAWMPFYVGDYLRDTMHLTAMENGAYIFLMLHYWEHGSVPETTAGRARVARLPEGTFRDHESTLAAFFSHPGWRHKRIDAELAKHEKIKRNRQIAGAKGGTKAQVGRYLRLASAQAFASNPNQALAQAKGVPTTEERKNPSLTDSEGTPRAEEGVGEQGRGNGLQPSPLLEAELRRKGWVPP